MREVALLNFEGNLQSVAEDRDVHIQSMDFGTWKAEVGYGVSRFPGAGASGPKGNPEPTGGAIVGRLGDNEFLVAGRQCRVDFHPSDPSSRSRREFMRVEEGAFENGVFKPVRIWNGDQTDWGLNFGSVPAVLRVRIREY
jgi:hypothetical protein